MKKLLFAALCLLTTTVFAQTNFTYTPEKPQAGDEITISYSPSGDLTGIMKMPEAFALVMGSGKGKIIDIPLKRENGKLTGKIKTDTSANLLAFGFTIDDKYDNNNNDGYVVPLYKEGTIKKGSYANMAVFYQSLGPRLFKLGADASKVIAAYDKEFSLYPESKDKERLNYLLAQYRENKDKGTIAIQTEIEKRMSNGLNTKEDYADVQMLYTYLRLRNQSQFIGKLKNEKYPSAELSIDDYYAKYVQAKNKEDKVQILHAVKAAAVKDSKKADEYKDFINYLQSNIAEGYAVDKDWEGFKKAAATITDKAALAGLYNKTAWMMQENNINLPFAEEISKWATTYTVKNRMVALCRGLNVCFV